MSMDFRKTTYIPNRPHTRLGTSYGCMSRWMTAFTDSVKRPYFPSSLYIQDDVHLQYGHQAGYDDFHKAFLNLEKRYPTLTYPAFGPPRLRYGRAGGSWRHVKEMMQARGGRTLFVDGQIRNEDNDRLGEIPYGNVLQPNLKCTQACRDRSCYMAERDRTSRTCNVSQS